MRTISPSRATTRLAAASASLSRTPFSPAQSSRSSRAGRLTRNGGLTITQSKAPRASTQPESPGSSSVLGGQSALDQSLTRTLTSQSLRRAFSSAHLAARYERSRATTLCPCMASATDARPLPQPSSRTEAGTSGARLRQKSANRKLARKTVGLMTPGATSKLPEPY